MTAEQKSDIEAIARLLESSFDAISWSPDGGPDWEAFFGPYLEGAVLAPSARPAALTGPQAFRTRMDAQRSDGAMTHFEEASTGVFVRVFGNVAIAANAFRGKVNQQSEFEGVNMYVLVKDAGAWKVACVAWDNATPERPVPTEFLARP